MKRLPNRARYQVTTLPSGKKKYTFLYWESERKAKTLKSHKKGIAEDDADFKTRKTLATSSRGGSQASGYLVNGKLYTWREGSRRQVLNGTAIMTKGRLTMKDFFVDEKNKRIKSRTKANKRIGVNKSAKANRGISRTFQNALN